MQMRNWGLVGLMMVAQVGFSAKGAGGAAPDESLAKAWQEILTAYVDRASGKVNYPELNKNKAKLDAFIGRHASLDTKALSNDAKKAIYINLYNATMMANLLRHAAEQKIDVAGKKFTELRVNDIKVPGGNIWNGSYTVKLGGMDVTLDNIEHDLIRGKGKGQLKALAVTELDPRIHAAVNCAALSCPRVREQAYSAKNINQLLDENLRAFLANKNQFRKAGDSKLRANSIVFWYYDDFDDHAQAKKMAGAGDYLAQFVGADVVDGAWLQEHLKKNFNDRSTLALRLSSAFDFHYDWRVNDQRNQLGD